MKKAWALVVACSVVVWGCSGDDDDDDDDGVSCAGLTATASADFTDSGVPVGLGDLQCGTIAGSTYSFDRDGTLNPDFGSLVIHVPTALVGIYMLTSAGEPYVTIDDALVDPWSSALCATGGTGGSISITTIGTDVVAGTYSVPEMCDGSGGTITAASGSFAIPGT